MNRKMLKLKVGCLLRKIGLSRTPVPVIACLAVICLALVGFAAYRFWPVANASESVSYELVEEEQSSEGEEASSKTEIAVDVEGAVNEPGLYRMLQGARVGDAIQAAGGFSKKAQRSSVNLAAVLDDGQQIIVATIEEQKAGDPQASQLQPSQLEGVADSGKININTATSEELQTLSGIGEAMAQRIIDYRQTNGSFSSIEDIQNVSGIGEARFASIKDCICV